MRIDPRLAMASILPLSGCGDVQTFAVASGIGITGLFVTPSLVRSAAIIHNGLEYARSRWQNHSPKYFEERVERGEGKTVFLPVDPASHHILYSGRDCTIQFKSAYNLLFTFVQLPATYATVAASDLSYLLAGVALNVLGPMALVGIVDALTRKE